MIKIVSGWVLFLVGLGVFIGPIISAPVAGAGTAGTVLWSLGAIASGAAILGGVILMVDGICERKVRKR